LVRTRWSALLAASLSCAVPGAAHAATLAVDDDGAQCTDARHTSIQRAVDAAAPGDTIAICPGRYAEGTGAVGTNALTIRKSLTIRGAGADEVTITPSRRDANPGAITDGALDLRDGVGDVVAVIGDPALPVTVDLSGVTVSGAGVQVEAGVVFLDAQGSLNRSRVTDVVTTDLAVGEDVPGGFRNGDAGVGVAQVTAATGAAGLAERVLRLEHTRIDRYNRFGLLIDGATGDAPPLTASGVPNRGVLVGDSVVGQNLCTQAAQTGDCSDPQPITTGRLFGQDGVRVTAGASVSVEDSLVSQNHVHGAGAPVRSSRTAPDSTEGNANLALGAGLRLIGAAASAVTASNVVANAYGAHVTELDGTTANAATPLEAEGNWWGLRYPTGPTSPTTNPGPAVSPATNPPIPENPVNGTETTDAEGRTSTAVDFSPYRNGFQGDPFTGELPVAEAPLPVSDAPPTVALAAAASEAERGATVELTATAGDDFGIRRVTFFDGAEAIGTASGASPRLAFRVPLDAACASRTLTAVVEDSSGQTAASAPVTLTVAGGSCLPPPPPAPPTPPVVVVPGPPGGPSVPGGLPRLPSRGRTVVVAPIAPAGVARVDFLLGTRRVCTVSAAPYTCFVRPTGADVGEQVLRVVVTDALGRTAQATQAVTVPRFRPRALVLRSTTIRRADGTRRVVVTGRLDLPAVVTPAQGCRTGTIGLVLRRNGSSITDSEVRLRRTCTFRRTVVLPRRRPGVRFTLTARFGGNDVLAPRSATRRFR
jgi:hypothetical protein